MTARDLIGCVLRTPTRLSMVGVLVLAASLTTANWIAHDTPSATGETSTASSRPRDGSAVPTADPVAQSARLRTNRPGERTGPDDRVARAAARWFLAAYLRIPGNPTSPVRWRRTIRPLVTPALWAGLRHTDPTLVPHGPARLQTRNAGSFAATMDARLAGGARLHLRLVVYQGRWRVADVEPAR